MMMRHNIILILYLNLYIYKSKIGCITKSYTQKKNINSPIVYSTEAVEDESCDIIFIYKKQKHLLQMRIHKILLLHGYYY